MWRVSAANASSNPRRLLSPMGTGGVDFFFDPAGRRMAGKCFNQLQSYLYGGVVVGLQCKSAGSCKVSWRVCIVCDVCLFVCPSFLSVSPSVCPSIRLSLSVRPSVCLSVCLCPYLSVFVSVSLSLCLSLCLCVCVCVCVSLGRLSISLSASVLTVLFLCLLLGLKNNTHQGHDEPAG
jgi:hypothetical protein